MVEFSFYSPLLSQYVSLNHFCKLVSLWPSNLISNQLNSADFLRRQVVSDSTSSVHVVIAAYYPSFVQYLHAKANQVTPILGLEVPKVDAQLRLEKYSSSSPWRNL